MKIVGIIAEYNPFHNGHQLHIEQAKAVTGADAVIVVMSGNFVQRGEPAILPKHLRALMALQSGVSAVFELPTVYATGSAEQFARGAVSILHRLGCVDCICFGSECGNLTALKEVADILSCEEECFRKSLQSWLKTGLSYPFARQKALEEVYPDKPYANLLKEPNNILGIEYLKALQYYHSNMEAFTIQRQGSGYHDKNLKETFSSATAIRECIERESLGNISNQVPIYALEVLEKKKNERYPIVVDDFSVLLKYRLLNESKTSLLEYMDVSEELANRIWNHRNQFVSFTQFCELLKTKEVTYSRISRALLHILLNIRPLDTDDIPYARLLGFRSDRAEVLSCIKAKGTLTLVTKLSTYDHPMLETDIYASNLYESIITEKFKTAFINEYEHPVVRI